MPTPQSPSSKDNPRAGDGAGGSGEWALANLVLTLLGLLLALLLLALALRRRGAASALEQHRNRHALRRGLAGVLASLGLGLVAALVFLAGSDLSGTMALVNAQTVLHAVILAMQVVVPWASWPRGVSGDRPGTSDGGGLTNLPKPT
jgi:membrane protease YdiL (CAAX protease family)